MDVRYVWENTGEILVYSDSDLAPTKLYYALAFCILNPLTNHTHTKPENKIYICLLIPFKNSAMGCMFSSQINYVQ